MNTFYSALNLRIIFYFSQTKHKDQNIIFLPFKKGNFYDYIRVHKNTNIFMFFNKKLEPSIKNNKLISNKSLTSLTINPHYYYRIVILLQNFDIVILIKYTIREKISRF